MQDKKELHETTMPKQASGKWWQTKRTKMAANIGFVIAVLIFLVWFFAFHPFISTDDARVSADIVYIAYAGASGQVLRVNAEEGDNVGESAVLVELDHRIAEAQYDQAKARFEYAQASFKRVSVLSEGAGSTKQQYDMAKADAATAEANMKLAQIALERTYLKSPVSGVVIKKIAVPGNILEVNQVALIIADTGHAWVSANISEKSISRVKPGQSVRITVDEGGSIKGKVAEVRKAAASVFSLMSSDNASGNFIKVTQRIPVKIALEPHPGVHLRVGESVEVSIKVN